MTIHYSASTTASKSPAGEGLQGLLPAPGEGAKKVKNAKTNLLLALAPHLTLEPSNRRTIEPSNRPSSPITRYSSLITRAIIFPREQRNATGGTVTGHGASFGEQLRRFREA